MPRPTCPRCGAPREEAEPHPLARCEWCGALLASPGGVSRPLQAARRIDPGDARRRARTALDVPPSSVRFSGTMLVYYPFRLVASTRSPLEPLADLPPALAAHWRASGADLVYDDHDDGAGEIETARVPIASEPPAGQQVVFYPFYRVTVEVGEETDAVWVDAVDGQALYAAADEPDRQRPQQPDLARWIVPSLAAGAASGLVLPFPISLVPAAAAAAWFWRRTKNP